jgi:hypothetical protein
MGEMRKIQFKILYTKPEGKRHFGELGIDWKIVIKWVLKDIV